MTTIHRLTIEDRFRSRLWDNQKHAEVRNDDRDFQTGDEIMFVNESGGFTGLRRTITHVLRASGFGGLEDGYVVLSLEDTRVARVAALERENERLVRSNRSLRARARSLAAKQ
jgi:hypothetical protein